MCNSFIAVVPSSGRVHRMPMLRISVFAFALAACSVPPLTTEDLTGDKRDASATEVDAATEARVDAGNNLAPADAATQMQDVAPDVVVGGGILSGIVVDHCGGKPISALVGIAGQHTCSFAGKGAFYFTGLPVGIDHTLASAAPGYQAFSTVLVPSAAGIPFDIHLIRLGASFESPCAVPEPPAPMCSCVKPGCI